MWSADRFPKSHGDRVVCQHLDHPSLNTRTVPVSEENIRRFRSSESGTRVVTRKCKLRFRCGIGAETWNSDALELHCSGTVFFGGNKLFIPRIKSLYPCAITRGFRAVQMVYSSRNCGSTSPAPCLFSTPYILRRIDG